MGQCVGRQQAQRALTTESSEISTVHILKQELPSHEERGSPEVNVTPKLKISTELLEILNDLDDVDFDTFKWHLKSESKKNIKPIQQSRLTKAERHAMVDLMVKKYEISGAVEVMESVLMKISRNDLVEKLRLLTEDA